MISAITHHTGDQTMTTDNAQTLKVALDDASFELEFAWLVYTEIVTELNTKTDHTLEERMARSTACRETASRQWAYRLAENNLRKATIWRQT